MESDRNKERLQENNIHADLVVCNFQLIITEQKIKINIFQ